MTIDPNSIPKYPEDAAFAAEFAAVVHRFDLAGHPEYAALADDFVFVVGEHGLMASIPALVDLAASLTVSLAANLPDEVRRDFLETAVRWFAFGHDKTDGYRRTGFPPTSDTVTVAVSEGGHA